MSGATLALFRNGIIAELAKSTGLPTGRAGYGISGDRAAMVLMALAAHANESSTAYPSQLLLATELGISRNSVQDALHALTELGHIVPLRKVRRGCTEWAIVAAMPEPGTEHASPTVHVEHASHAMHPPVDNSPVAAAGAAVGAATGAAARQHKEEEEEESIDQRDDPRSRAVAPKPETSVTECPLAGHTTSNNEADWKPHTDCHCDWISDLLCEINDGLWWTDGDETPPGPPWNPDRNFRIDGGATLTHWTKKEIAGPLYRQAARLANGWEPGDVFTQLAAYQDNYRAATNPVGLLISKLKNLNTRSPRTIAREEADQRIQRQMQQREEELRALETGAFITDPQHIQRIREEEQQRINRLRLVNETA